MIENPRWYGHDAQAARPSDDQVASSEPRWPDQEREPIRDWTPWWTGLAANA